jgi:hypothetical protein
MKNKSGLTPLRSLPGKFMWQLYLILIGLAFGFSTEEFVNNLGLIGFLHFLTIIVLLISWLHGQQGFEESRVYQERPSLAAVLVEHYLEIAGVLVLLAASLLQNAPFVFHQVIALVFLLDYLLEMIYFRRLRKSNTADPHERELIKSWMLTDMAAFIPLSLVAGFEYHSKAGESAIVAGLVLLIVLATTIWDYTRHREYYFDIKPVPKKAAGQKAASWRKRNP